MARVRPPIPDEAFKRQVSPKARASIELLVRASGSTREAAHRLGTMPAVIVAVLQGELLPNRTADFIEGTLNAKPIVLDASHMRAPK